MIQWSPILLSLKVSAIATLVAAVAGIILAILLATRKFPGRDLLDVLFTVPMILPPTVLGYYVLVAVGRRSFIGGVWEDIFGSPIVFTQTGAVLAAMLGALPFVVKSSRTAFEGVPPVLVQAARTLGANRLRVFWTVRIPLAWPGIMAGIMLGFARALGDFGATLMVAGNIPGKTQTASLAIYDAIQANREREALAMIVVLTAVAVFMLYAANKLTGKPHPHA